MAGTSVPLLDLESSPVHGQIASAVLDLNGNVIKGKLPGDDAALLFQILVEAGSLNLERFRRLSVVYSGVRFVVSRDETHVYIVQTKAM
jgi:hypothetical protein